MTQFFLTRIQISLMKWTKDRPFWECPDEIDVAMIGDALAAFYRFLPEEESIPIFLQCLEPERSEAVKICVVKACLALIVDVRLFMSLCEMRCSLVGVRAGSCRGSDRWGDSRMR